MIPASVWRTLGIVAAVLIVWLAIRKPQGVGSHKTPDIDPNRLNPNRDYAAIATELHNAFTGIDWTSVKSRAITKHMELNDDEFIQVYIIYNRLYKLPPESLRTDYESEWIFDLGIGYSDRFDRLQLP